MGLYRYAISLAATTGFTYLKDVPLSDGRKMDAPLNTYKPSTKVLSLASGGVRRVGSPIDTWFWASLDATGRAFFRTYCPGAFANPVWIRTLTDDNVWVTAKVVMLWMPNGEQWQSDFTMSFTLTFKVLSTVVVTL